MATKGPKGKVDIHIWITPSLQVKIKQLAWAEYRSINKQCEMLLEEAIKARTNGKVES